MPPRPVVAGKARGQGIPVVVCAVVTIVVIVLALLVGAGMLSNSSREVRPPRSRPAPIPGVAAPAGRQAEPETPAQPAARREAPPPPQTPPPAQQPAAPQPPPAAPAPKAAKPGTSWSSFDFAGFLKGARIAAAWTTDAGATATSLGLDPNGEAKNVCCFSYRGKPCQLPTQPELQTSETYPASVEYPLSGVIRAAAKARPTLRCHVGLVNLDDVPTYETAEWSRGMGGAPPESNMRNVLRDIAQFMEPGNHVLFIKATDGCAQGHAIANAVQARLLCAATGGADVAPELAATAFRYPNRDVQAFGNAAAKAGVEAVFAGSWTSVDLAPMDAINAAIAQVRQAEGHSGELITERKVYWQLARLPFVKRVCEIGFNRGNSAALWLRANPNIEVVMFDLFLPDHGGKEGEAFLRGSRAADLGVQNGDRRLTIIKGSSLQKVPQWARANPDKKCDIISVDGGHTYDIALADLTNMKALVNPDFHIGLIDDTNCDAHWCVDPPLEKHESQGLLRTLFRAAEWPLGPVFLRGITVFQYHLEEPPAPCTACPALPPMPPPTPAFTWARFLKESGVVASDWGAGEAETAAWLGMPAARPVTTVCCVTPSGKPCAVQGVTVQLANAFDAAGLDETAKKFKSVLDPLTMAKPSTATEFLSVTVRNFAGNNPTVRCHVALVDLGALEPREYEGWSTKMAGVPPVNNLQNLIRDVSALMDPDGHVVFVTGGRGNEANNKCGGDASKPWRTGGVLCSAVAGQPAPAGASEAAAANVTTTALRYPLDVIPFARPDVAAAVARVKQQATWRTVGLAPLNKLNERLGAAAEGHSGDLIIERQVYYELASMPHVKRICEIGFNKGNSAALWLHANPTAEVVMFDLWLADHGGPQSESFLRSAEAERFGIVEGNRRLTIVKGSSLDKVPEWARANPDKKCDIVSVDGGHTYDIALQDLKNMRALVNASFHIALIDDTNCDPFYCVDPALEKIISDGFARPLMRYAEPTWKDPAYNGFLRGITVFQYVDKETRASGCLAACKDS